MMHKNPSVHDFAHFFKVSSELHSPKTSHRILPVNIQYILTKAIMDKYLISIHKKIRILFPYVKKTELTHNSIFNFYYTWISDKNDIFDCHLAMLKELYLQ